MEQDTDVPKSAGIHPAEAEETGGEGKRKKNYLKVIVIFLIVIIAIPAGLYIKELSDRSDPDYYLKFQRLGRHYFRKGEWGKASTEFKKAVKYQPDQFGTHYDLALTHLKLHDLRPAIEEFKAALEIVPNNMDAHYSLGTAYQRMEMFELALKEYHIVATAIPDSFQVYNNVGLIHTEVRDYDKAIMSFNRAIEIKPDHYQAYLNLGKVYEAQDQKDLAKEEYQKVRKMASQRPETIPYVREAEKRLTNLE